RGELVRLADGPEGRRLAGYEDQRAPRAACRRTGSRLCRLGYLSADRVLVGSLKKLAEAGNIRSLSGPVVFSKEQSNSRAAAVGLHHAVTTPPAPSASPPAPGCEPQLQCGCSRRLRWSSRSGATARRP